MKQTAASRRQTSRELQFNERLQTFLEKTAGHPAIGPFHIVLYLVLLRYWTDNGCPEQLPIASNLMIERSHIGRVVYFKTIRDLHEMGWIEYAPVRCPGKSRLKITLCPNTNPSME